MRGNSRKTNMQNKTKQSKAMFSLKMVERECPEIAEKYFDLKWKD